MTRPVRIGNVSGFYGDRPEAAREMVETGDVDVVCGDYLAELTMLILAKAQAREGGVGWARTFLSQVEQILGTCVRRGIRIVANAGGLDPAGCAAAVREVAGRLGIDARVAHVEGDDLRGDLGAVVPPVTGDPVSANAYLGGWGITAALAAGADVVVTGRVTDAALVSGPAAWWHGWGPGDLDALAGAVVAGHVIECGPQATGGNYPFLDEITDRRYPGFPIAEVAADGSSVITKPDGSGGLVSVGTVTAQLLYEIGPPAYPGPDVTTHFDTVRLEPAGEHRVAIGGVRGTPPPPTLKVALNDDAGHRNTMTLVLTGLDVEAKAAHAEQLLFGIIDRSAFDEVDVRLLRFDHPDAAGNAEATAHLRITVKGRDRRTVGRAFSNATMQLALGGYAGFHTTTPPTDASAFGVYRPAAVPRAAVTHTVVLPDGTRHVVPDPPETAAVPGPGPRPPGGAPRGDGPGAGATRRVPLGTVAGARSGDKGGDANIGVWARDDAAHAWLDAYLTPERVRELLGAEAAGLGVAVHRLPNLRAVNVVVHGLLGDGVASSTRPDPQAKGLGEYLRSRLVDVPVELLG
ncbi:acyclic terpene utilization AtuA family protein [Pseudonocardia spirodelae]|uniref:Acyclic terpene utilization AtuA family protein n=1 Tax=Pseudonocardia spirodelae TaxID=3133431 RepID=A0ABU8T441_9PSEU